MELASLTTCVIRAVVGLSPTMWNPNVLVVLKIGNKKLVPGARVLPALENLSTRAVYETNSDESTDSYAVVTLEGSHSVCATYADHPSRVRRRWRLPVTHSMVPPLQPHTRMGVALLSSSDVRTSWIRRLSSATKIPHETRRFPSNAVNKQLPPVDAW